jgi:ferric-dicitrate binding protein FerR (iron transport regulator)
MKKFLGVTAALALLGANLPALAASATVTRAWQFKPESSAGLEVRNLIGDVRVERGSAPGVQVTVRATVEAESQAEAERLLGLIEYRTADVGAGSRFDVFLSRKHFPKIYWSGGGSMWWGIAYTEHLGERLRLVRDRDDGPAVRVDLVIRMPEGARLTVNNRLGEMVAEGVSGELRLDGSSGMLRSAGGEGRLTLDSGSGRVEVAGHRGYVNADTGSGAVMITGCECEIVADTGSGSVDIQGGAGKASADTGSGRVTIENFGGSLRADTGSGSVRVRGASNVRTLDADTGSGSVDVEGDLSALERMRIDTGSGSVRLESSAAPSIEIRIDTGSGGVHVDAPGASVRESDDIWRVTLQDGAGRGTIDTGSGSVRLTFP